VCSTSTQNIKNLYFNTEKQTKKNQSLVQSFARAIDNKFFTRKEKSFFIS